MWKRWVASWRFEPFSRIARYALHNSKSLPDLRPPVAIPTPERMPHVNYYGMAQYLIVLVGGGTGALLRFILGTLIMQRYGGSFPLGTFTINITGSFLIGFLMALFTEHLQPHPYWRLLLVVGFLGGYTTFSTFEYETFVAARQGARWMALLNVVGSVILGYVAVWLGTALAARR